jgi:hypothetical protein
MRRFWIVAGAFALTLGALVLPMMLGSAVFDFSRFQDHEGRLRRVMRQQPTAELLGRAFQDEGTVQLAVARTREDLEHEASTRGGAKAAEIREKGARSAETRVYRAGDMLYFVFFDAGGVMRDFTCVSR